MATAIAAVFLTQLDQFVLALGVDFAVKTLVQAAAFAIGVALYTVDWTALRRRLARGISVSQACRMHGVDLETLLGRLRRARFSG